MPNRLAQSASPYLLQHADNPVDWWPWCDEAFAEARRRDLPVFLSIGYSTCHWCHVMAHESFEDPATAALLNQTCIAVKLDREERPDIDDIYMQALQRVSGNGGWPMSLMLDHDRRPFFLGTYLPPEDRYGRMSFPTLLKRVGAMWREKREELNNAAASITDGLREEFGAAGAATTATTTAPVLNAAVLERAVQQLAGRFDAQNGGFGHRPKFPTPHVFQFLLREHARAGAKLPLDMVTHSLTQMARGGIHDQVGGGFHRYSTDGEWLLPHFEKMLYDQALHALAYTEAHQTTGNPMFAEVARGVFRYAMRDLRDPKRLAAGQACAFFSAEDADSEGEEGTFYVWTVSELKRVLGDAHGPAMAQLYGCTDTGNFAEEATGSITGANVLSLRKGDALRASGPHGSDSPDYATVEANFAKLFAAREKRPRPHLDDKVLASWNGLMISALALGARALNDPALADAASSAAHFVLTEMRAKENLDAGLIHAWRAGVRTGQGFLDDHAFMARGLLDLYQTTFELRCLDAAAELCRVMIRDFGAGGSAAGGLFLAREGQSDLLIRRREVYDGAEPSGNSVGAEVLLRLGRLLGNAEFTAAGHAILAAFAREAAMQPQGHTQLLCAVSEAVVGGTEITLSLPAGAAGPETAGSEAAVFIAKHRAGFAPATLVLVRREEEAARLSRLAPTTAAQTPIGNQPTAYICRDGVCGAPVRV